MNLLHLIRDFLKAGGEISGVKLIYDEDGSDKTDRLYYVIDTGMKSNLLISPGDAEEEYYVRDRYMAEPDLMTFDNVEKLVREIWDRCLCGRDFYGSSMAELAIKFNIRTGLPAVDNQGVDRKQHIEELKAELAALKERDKQT